MKKIIITTVSLFIFSFSFGQTEIIKSNISSGGGTVTSGSTKIIYTVGEIIAKENTQGTVHISEGFINPNMFASTGIKESAKLQNVKLYPNPAKDFVNVKFSEICNNQIILCNVYGKQLALYSNKSCKLQKIKINYLANGTYFLIVKNLNLKKYKTFKLIKK